MSLGAGADKLLVKRGIFELFLCDRGEPRPPLPASFGRSSPPLRSLALLPLWRLNLVIAVLSQGRFVGLRGHTLNRVVPSEPAPGSDGALKQDFLLPQGPTRCPRSPSAPSRSPYWVVVVVLLLSHWRPVEQSGQLLQGPSGLHQFRGLSQFYMGSLYFQRLPHVLLKVLQCLTCFLFVFLQRSQKISRHHVQTQVSSRGGLYLSLWSGGLTGGPRSRLMVSNSCRPCPETETWRRIIADCIVLF